jgi:methionyl aminopeptidase
MSIEHDQDLAGIRRVSAVVRETLDALEAAVRPGITTGELDAVGAAVLERYGARSAPNLVYGFPGVNLISLNDEAVHGIPGRRVIRPGDLVKLDVTVELDGFIADAARSVPVPPVSRKHRQICDCAEAAFRRALRMARPGVMTRDLGKAIEAEVRRRGFHVLHELGGHGVGRTIHEAPTVPNFWDRSVKDRLAEGMVLTIEPIIAERRGPVETDRDGWTIRTQNRSLSAHYEHTLLITRGEAVILTA